MSRSVSTIVQTNQSVEIKANEFVKIIAISYYPEYEHNNGAYGAELTKKINDRIEELSNKNKAIIVKIIGQTFITNQSSGINEIIMMVLMEHI